MKTNFYNQVSNNAELRNGLLDEVLDMIDTISGGCIDEVGAIRLLNQYALLLRTMPTSETMQPQTSIS